MAIYHFYVGIVSRSSGRSSVAAAAYRAAEKLHDERGYITHDYTDKSNAVNAAAYRSGENLHNEQHGITYDYTRKKGVEYSEIILPDHAPQEYKDRATLWNAVERAEKQWNAQTARDIDVALPMEFNRQEQIELMREYIQDNFVSQGMCADFAIHDKGDGNPHAHIMLTVRPLKNDGTWGAKSSKEYIFDKNGERIKLKSGEYKSRKINTVDWNETATLEKWREKWAAICNERFEEKGLTERIDHRTLAAQGLTREPTIHHGYSRTLKAQNDEIIRKNDEYINGLKDGCTLLEKQIADLHAEKEDKLSQLLPIEITINDITKRSEQIKSLREARETNKHNKMLENSYTQALSYFEREYKFPPEQAQVEIERLQAQAKPISRELADIDIEPYSELLQTFRREYSKNRPHEKQKPQLTREDVWEIYEDLHYYRDHRRTRERERGR